MQFYQAILVSNPELLIKLQHNFREKFSLYRFEMKENLLLLFCKDNLFTSAFFVSSQGLSYCNFHFLDLLGSVIRLHFTSTLHCCQWLRMSSKRFRPWKNQEVELHYWVWTHSLRVTLERWTVSCSEFVSPQTFPSFSQLSYLLNLATSVDRWEMVLLVCDVKAV